MSLMSSLSNLDCPPQDSKQAVIPEVSPLAGTSDQPTNVADTATEGNSNPVVIEEEDDEEALDLSIVASLPLSYENTKKSPYYSKAKDALQLGEFEVALATIETGITSILSLQSQPDEMHESIAPLYYLYGTTLLYSIEESQENPETSVMAAQQQEGGENSAEDLQIAWENLETARSILTRCPSDKLSEEDKEERGMDLAQIHCRLADLSRHDGHYERAIEDYMTCCESRRQILAGDRVWDRKVADIEYSLGMTCLLLAAEGEKNLLDGMETQDGKVSGKIAAAATASAASVNANPFAPDVDQNEENKVKLTPEEITALREKSARHYVQCSRILAGLIGIMCGQNPNDVAAADSNLESIDGKKMSSEPTKTSGLDLELSVQEQASAALKVIRDRVAQLNAQDSEDNERVHDLREMLDEIQETLDTSEKDKEGLRDISLMRKKAEEDANKSDEPVSNVSDAAGGTTSIGFGQVTSEGTTFTASASMTSNVEAAPMMIVKKKKKRDDDEKPSNDESSKRAKTE